MKKNKVILVGILLVSCLIACLIIVKIVLSRQKEECEYTDFEDIIYEINAALNENFTISEGLTIYIPVSLSKDIDYVFAINTKYENGYLNETEYQYETEYLNETEYQYETEYFVIIKNITDKDLAEFKSALNLINTEQQKLEIKQSGIYTYIIFSEHNYSSIDGIIKSLSSCYKKELFE